MSSSRHLSTDMIIVLTLYTFEYFIQKERCTLTLLLVISAALNVALTRGPLPAPSTITMIVFLHTALSPSPLCSDPVLF